MMKNEKYIKGFETFLESIELNSVKTRLKNGFLNIVIDDTNYKAWFPNWFSIEKEYLERLNRKDKSLLIIEDDMGNSKQIEIDGRKFMDIWLNNKNNNKVRQILIDNTVKYHKSNK